QGRSYYVMEYVEATTLQDAIERAGRLPWSDVLAVALQVAPALKHAHDRGIIHRDLKPANLLLKLKEESGKLKVEKGMDDPSSTLHSRLSNCEVKLSDFGIASLFSGTHLTVTGSIVGTAEYLSHEQAMGKPVTRRSDLYSLGVVLYTLLTGRTPFSD